MSERVTLSDLRAANVARQAEWCPDQVPDLSFRGNELAGEAGEASEALVLHAAELGRAAGLASNVIKKLERERHGWRGSRASLDDLAGGLADVVICADLCAMTAGVDLAGAVVSKFNASSEKVGLATRLAAESPLQAPRVSIEGLVSALDIASLKADSRDDAEALRAAADLVQNYAAEVGAALAGGVGTWSAWSEVEADSDPSDPGCGHATVWRVGWWRKGAAHADIEHSMGADEFRARALAAALNGLPALPLALPPASRVEGEVFDPVLRERAACAYLAECHTGLWDNATAEAIGTAIRERGRETDDFALVSREAWAAVQPVWLLLRHGQALPAELSERIARATVDLMTSAPPEVMV